MFYKIYDVNTPIEFGRYQGKTLLEVAREDKSYLEWFIEEIDNVGIDDELLNYLNYQEIQSLSNIRILEDRLLVEEELDYTTQEEWDELFGINNKRYEEIENDSNSKTDHFYVGGEYLDKDVWSDIAGTNDPDVINDIYWNLD